MLDDAPQPLVGDAHEAGGGQHRHLAHQDHRRLLEQQREAAALARPRHLDPLDPVIRAIDPRHPRRDEAVMLEEVQMPPGEAGEVVRLAGRLPHPGTGTARRGPRPPPDAAGWAACRCRAAGRPASTAASRRAPRQNVVGVHRLLRFLTARGCHRARAGQGRFAPLPRWPRGHP